MKNYINKIINKLSHFKYLFKAIKIVWSMNTDEYKSLYEKIDFNFGV